MRREAMKTLWLLLAGTALLLPTLSLGGDKMEEITRDKILATGSQWQQKYDQYRPAQDMLEALKSKLGENVRIEVYLGTWCPDSRNNVPAFIKILDLLETRVSVRYFDLPRKPSKDVQYYVEDLKVERVPTFIFYRDGKEIGRIVENPKAGMIEDMMDVLFRES